jgi:hypothetical protein
MGVSVYSYSHDLLGSYRPGIALLIALLGLGIVLVLQLGEYPFRQVEADAIEDHQRTERALALDPQKSLV